MENAVATGRASSFGDVFRGLESVRPCGVDFDATKSDAWQVNYMFMVAQAFGAVSGVRHVRACAIHDVHGDAVASGFSGCVGEGCGFGHMRGRLDAEFGGLKFGDCGCGGRDVAAGDSVSCEDSGQVRGNVCLAKGGCCAAGVAGSDRVASHGDTSSGAEAEVVSDGDTSGSGVCGSGRRDGGLGFVESLVSEKLDTVRVGKSSKKKFGKNQRDRAKRGLGAGARDWRAGVGSTDLGVGDAQSLDKVVVDDKSVARKTLEKKWEVENRVAIAKAELAEEKAKKDLEFQRARDVDAEARKSRAKIMKETESSKVATEKAFAFLKSTGNIPGFCETVVSGGVESGSGVPGLSNGSSPDCTISPDSSASMHEFRKCQKELEDLKFENAKIRRQLEYGKLAAGEEAAFTINSDNDVSESVKEVIKKNTTDYYDVEIRDDSYGQDRAYTMYAKRISIPGADEFSFDY